MSLVDLSQLPPPDAVETLSYVQIRQERIDLLAEVAPDLHASLVDGDPVYEAIENASMRELIQRARVNDGVKGVLLPSATGADLDNIGAFFDVPRLLLQAADPTASPPKEDVFESDDSYKAVIHETPRSVGTGTQARYERQAALADSRIASVVAVTPSPATLVLHWTPDVGVDPADHADIGAAIMDRINGVDERNIQVRLLTDLVSESKSDPVSYDVVAHLHMSRGPGSTKALEEANAAVLEYAAKARASGIPVPRSELIEALSQLGVLKVDLTSPAADLPPDPTKYYEVGAITITQETASWA